MARSTVDIEVDVKVLDPWRHRAAHMRCSTCMWFVTKDPGPVGRCRRHAPTLGGYPVVFPTDWCGDHKLDESTVGMEIGPVEDRGVS